MSHPLSARLQTIRHVHAGVPPAAKRTNHQSRITNHQSPIPVRASSFGFPSTFVISWTAPLSEKYKLEAQASGWVGYGDTHSLARRACIPVERRRSGAVQLSFVKKRCGSARRISRGALAHGYFAIIGEEEPDASASRLMSSDNAYFAASYRRATSSQLITLKNAAT